MPPKLEDLPKIIQRRLSASSYIGLRRISVDLVDDVVVLSGEVRSQYLRQIAQIIVQGVVANDQLRFELAVSGQRCVC